MEKGLEILLIIFVIIIASRSDAVDDSPMIEKVIDLARGCGPFS